METKCREAAELFDRIKKSLRAKDEALGIYTLAPSKNKDNVCYPKPFIGRLGENVHNFIVEFKLALEADHVRTTVFEVFKIMKSGASLAASNPMR